MTSYNGTLVFGAGQAFSITLSDGSTFNFLMTGTKTPTTTGLAAIAPPSWTGAAVGNTAFLGIPNKPILYTSAAGTITLTLSGITITPPPGGASGGQYKVVIADAESTNNSESLTYTTNGSAWTVVDQVPPITGSTYPTISGAGTATFAETGVAGTVGAYIVGTQTPTTVTAKLVAGGLQGIMFAVQYATISANKSISGSRANAADQFTYGIKTTSTGLTIASNTSTGSGLGPFGSAVATVSSNVPSTVYEQMAAGSVSQAAQYSPSLTCTNGNTGSSTVLPTNQPVTSYNIPSIAYGDAIACVFTNTPKPATVAIKKMTTGAAGGPFTFTQTNLASNPPAITTASAGVAAPSAPAPITVTAYNTDVVVTEGLTANFTISAASCSDANAAITGNPASFGTLSGQALTIPAVNVVAAAQITCTFTNAGNAPTFSLQKVIAGAGRVAASDQFSLQATGTGAPAPVVTTGSGTAVTSTPLSFTGTTGGSYVLTEAMAAGSTSALNKYLQSAACNNSNSLGTNVSGITTIPITITPAQGDGISCTITNTPVIVNLTISKTYSAATPVVVGQTITYTYTVANTGNVGMSNVQVKDMHGTPAAQIPLGAGGISNETLTVPGPLGAGASPDGTANNGIWSTLAPGATVQFTYTHTVTQAEIDHG